MKLKHVPAGDDPMPEFDNASDESRAWDAYVSGMLAEFYASWLAEAGRPGYQASETQTRALRISAADSIAQMADVMLLERRKRYP